MFTFGQNMQDAFKFYIYHRLFPITHVVITVEENGKIYDKVVNLNNHDELIDALLKAKQG